MTIGNSDPISPAFSNAFDVLANPVFTSVPSSNPTANSSFSVAVTVQDAGGAKLNNYNGQVALSTNSGTLLGITTVNALSGIATFNNLAFSNTGGYTLQAALPLGNTVNTNITIDNPVGCQSLVVNTTSQTGDDAGSGCNTITLTGALSRATTGDVIRFTSGAQGNPLILAAGAKTLPSGVSLQGGCDNNGPLVTITVSGAASTFQVGPNSTVWGIALTN